MQKGEREPRRKNSKVARVYPYLLADTPRWHIEEITGLHGDELTYAIRGNYRLGYVIPPSPNERRRMLGDNTSAGKGGVGLSVRRYEPLDLTAKQTKVVLEAFDGKKFTQHQIATAYSRARHRHGLERPVAELHVEAQRDKRRTEEELLNIAHRRKAAYEFAEKQAIPKPTSLEEWHNLEERLTRREEEQYQAQLLIERRDEQLLAELRSARLAWQESGDRKVYSDAIDRCEEIDPTFFERKRSDIEALRKSHEVKKDVAVEVEKRGGLAIHGEVTGGERSGN